MTDRRKKQKTTEQQATDARAAGGSLPKIRIRDTGAKLIFDNHTLCAQFLRGYTNVELLKDVQPEDIEDITERFLSVWQENRDSDSVKKIRLRGVPGEDTLYLITLIEHQSKVHYDMAFRVLQYIVMVLEDYAAEQEKKQKGIRNTKDFRYPPVLPVVFFDGPGNWTAEQNFSSRVYLKDVLGEFIPDFRYLVVPLSGYSSQELVDKGDELSLIMLVDKLRNAADFRKLKEIPREYFEQISRDSPESVLQLIGKIISALLLRINVPKEEVAGFTDRIERREFTMLFENFEAYDVQETRRVSRAEGRAEGRAEMVLELLEDKGSVPDALRERIMQERDLELLRKWHKAAAGAESVGQFLEATGCCPECTGR